MLLGWVDVLEAEAADSGDLVDGRSVWLGLGVEIRDVVQLNARRDLVLVRQDLQGLQPQRRLELEYDLLGIHAKLLAAPSILILSRDSTRLIQNVLVVDLDARSWMHRILRAVGNNIVPQPSKTTTLGLTALPKFLFEVIVVVLPERRREPASLSDFLAELRIICSHWIIDL